MHLAGLRDNMKRNCFAVEPQAFDIQANDRWFFFPPRGDNTKHVHEDTSCTPDQSLAQIQSQILAADSTFDRLPGAVRPKSLDQSWPQRERMKYGELEKGREREREQELQSGSEAEEEGV